MAKSGRPRSPVAAPAAAASAAAIPAWTLIFVAALALRILYVLSIRDEPFFRQLQTEPLRYHQWASVILAGSGAPLPPFEQAPAYPYFVAALYALFGRSLTAVVLVQALLDAATGALLAVTGRRWFGVRAGVITGVLAACYGPLIYFTGELLPSTLFVFAATAAVSAGAFAAWTLAGCLWALALLVRSEIILAVPFVLYGAWGRGGRRAVARTAAPLAVCMAAVLAFNAAGSGHLVLFTTNGGVNLWLGNNPHADGVNPFLSGPLEAVAEDVRAHAATAIEADQVFRRRALSFVVHEPGRALRLLWKKFLWTLTDRELPNTTDIEWVTGRSWLFWRPLFPLSFGMVLPLALAGATLLGRDWRDHACLTGLVVAGVGTAVIFFTNARFRLIMVPALLLLAAVAVDRLPRLLATWRDDRGALPLPALGLGTGLLLAWGDFYGVRAYRIAQLSVNTGIVEREAGQFDEAVRHLRDGLAAEPRDAIAWIHLALALEQQGNTGAARQAYRDALALMPEHRTLREMAGRFVQRRPEED